MSSMHRRLASVILLGLVSLSAPAQCQDGAEWDRARAQMMQGQPSAIMDAVARWKALTAATSAPFSEIAGFLLAYPGFPQDDRLRLTAEKSLALYPVDAARVIAFFDRYPPLTNPARAQYALALMTYSRPEAAEVARAAWRGGSMSDSAEAAISARWGTSFTPADQDARLNALLWDGNATQARRALAFATPGFRSPATARLYLLQGVDLTQPGQAALARPLSADPDPVAGNGDDPSGDAPAPGMATIERLPASPYAPAAVPALPPPLPQMALDASLLSDSGYVYSRARRLRQLGQAQSAASLLATRPTFVVPPLDPRKWVALQLAAARDAGSSDTVRIAERIDDSFTADTIMSNQPYAVRDDYTSLMWLGGTTALWKLSDPRRAGPLFYRYAVAARNPQTKAKGYYWAGRALAQAGQADAAQRYFQLAAGYPDQFYGMLALEKLGQPLPSLADPPHPVPTPAERAAFYATPLTQAVQAVAQDADWQTTIRFFRAIADRAETETQHVLVADLARSMGRRDLGVVLGQAAGNDRMPSFHDVAFPLIPVPAGADWTMVHAISRQESQFSQNAISRTGARGLMQLMPTTAAAEARKLGLPFSTTALTSDPQLNMQLGDAFFAHLMDVYGGSYPLAVAAYNAGPGNVNKWLASIGDPRVTGDWPSWIERLPFSETRGYVAHVLENAVVYEALYPARARYRGANPLSQFLGRKTAN